MRLFFTLILISIVFGCKTKKGEYRKIENTDARFFWAVDWHPFKDQFIVGGMQDTLRLFSSIDFKLLQNYPYKGTVTKTKWHPIKNKLAISVQDGKSYSSILDLENNQSLNLDSVSMEGARAIGWNHSGELLAVGDYKGNLTIYNEEGIFLKKIKTNQKSIIGLDWHPIKNSIVAIGEKITLYDYELDKLKHIEDRNKDVLMLCVVWHPDGKIFVTGDYGDFEYHYPPLLQYWTDDGEKVKSIEESKAEYRNIQWSSDGELLATASEKIRLWNKDGELVADAPSKNLLWGLDWNADNSKLVATDENGKIIFWDRQLNRFKELEF